MTARNPFTVRALARTLVEPTREQILRFCAQDPVERVFLEDVARRGLGRFVALGEADGELHALCHLGVNVVPSGDGCAAFARETVRAAPRMLIGESRRGVRPVGRRPRAVCPGPARTVRVSPSS